MRVSFAVIALLASTSAIQLTDQDDQLDLQIGVEAQARVNVRADLSQSLRQYLGKGPHPEWILPNSVPIKPKADDSPVQDVEYKAVQLGDEGYDGSREDFILPNSRAVAKADLPKDSDLDTAFIQMNDDLMSVDAARMQAA
jgi:hypothetical protein